MSKLVSGDQTVHTGHRGLLDLLCEHLTSDISGATLVVLHPRPDSDCRDKLDLLSVIGTQDLHPAG